MGIAKDRIQRYRPIKRKMVKDHHKETLAHALVLFENKSGWTFLKKKGQSDFGGHVGGERGREG